jgi:hypothetical protein
MPDFPEESFSLRRDESTLTIMVNPCGRSSALLYAVSKITILQEQGVSCRMRRHVVPNLRKARVPH